MKTYNYMIITRDDKTPCNHFKTLSGAKTFMKRLPKEQQMLTKIIPIGSEASKYVPNTEWVIK